MEEVVIKKEPTENQVSTTNDEEVINLLLEKSMEGNESSLESVDFVDENNVPVSVSLCDSSTLDTVSLADANMLLSSADTEINDGTAVVQSFESVRDVDSSESVPQFIDGQAVQLEDGTTAFIHTTPREGLQPIQLEDGTMAYLSQSGNEELYQFDQSDIIEESSDLDLEGLDSSQGENFSRIVCTTNQGRNKIIRCEYPDCSKFYTTLHHWKVHERTHTGARPFKCLAGGCTKAFATSYGLKSHTRVHTGETPYKCRHCTKAFKTSGDLQKHSRTHTGERPFKCSFDGCERSFTTSNIRKVHERTHTGERPYICQMDGCDKAFASATNYKNHVRIHTGEKPYVCSFAGCSKQFTEYSSLYKHGIVHTHKRPYTCNICGRVYRQTSTLSMHMRSSHGVLEDETEEEKFQRRNYKEDEAATSILEIEAEKSDVSNAEAPKIKNVTDKVPKVTATLPTIVTLHSDEANKILQEHNVYAVQIQEGTTGTTMQQIVLVTDPSQLAALQQQLLAAQQIAATSAVS